MSHRAGHSFLIAAPLALLAIGVSPPPGLTQEPSPRVPLHGSSLEAPPSVAEMLSPHRGDPDAAEVERLLGNQARATGFPQTPQDAVLVARLWRRAGDAGRALAALEAIPMAETGSLALLERARVLLETDADREAGARAYWAACDRLDEAALADLEFDLLAVSTPDERAAWAEGSVDRSGCDWLRDFWSERAQRMAIATDERVALHYRRLAHARDWYWIPRPRYAESWADLRGRPDGLPLDDRGLVYVRMGPPETDEGFIGLGSEGVDVDFQVADLSNATPSFLTGVPDDALDESRCWPYPRADGYRIFCFSQTSTSGQARADGDYKLQSSIVAEPGTRFYHKYVANSNLPRAWVRDRLRARTASAFGAVREPWVRNLDEAERRHYGNVAEAGTRDNISEAVAQVPDVPSVLPSARLQVETLRFLNPSERAWQIWTLAGVRAGDLTSAPDPDGVATLVAGGRFSVLSDSDVEVHELAPRSIPEASVPDDAGIHFHTVFRARPGPLPLTVVIEDGNRPNAGNYLLDTLNVPAIGGLPMVSDVAIARDTGGDWTRDGETFLQITPAHVANDDGSIHAYFEVYQVRPGTEYEVEVRMAPVELTEEILRLDPSELDFRLQFTAEMDGVIGRHHLRLDLGDAAPGEYSLALRVQDVDTKAYSLPAVTDVFVPRAGVGR
ncbi:MAG: hypothetical protein ACODAB_01685 [Gemmatimonadota bacterium]